MVAYSLNLCNSIYHLPVFATSAFPLFCSGLVCVPTIIYTVRTACVRLARMRVVDGENPHLQRLRSWRNRCFREQENRA